VNLSDLAAMAAQPQAAFVSLALPRAGGLALAKDLYEGLLGMAQQFDVTIAGGDTNSWDGPLVVAVTALGRVTGRGPLVRSGARPGDDILVTGSLGGSILGRHLDFTPRVREALWLHQHFELHAGMDISDGLSLDLSRLAEASGCGALVEVERVPVSSAAHSLAATHPHTTSALEHALSDGEDFELLLAVPPAESQRMLNSPDLPLPITRIGTIVAEPGLWQARAGGSPVPLPARGYEHSMT
jgi:thiamine-monophosphate kinase